MEDSRFEAQEAVLEAYPGLRNMYKSGPDGNNLVYYLKDATAAICSFTHEPVIITF